MSKKLKRMTASLLSAVMLMSPYSIHLSAAFAESSIPTSVDGTQNVAKTSDLTISFGDVDALGKYNASAYEVLQMVRPVGDSADPTTIKPNEKDGLYCATTEFAPFFEQAFTDYKAFKDSYDIDENAKVYLTYDETNKRLNMSKDTPTEGTINIEIKYDELFDESFFAADIVSRINDADSTTTSAAIIFSNWLTKYVKGKNITATKTASLEKTEDNKTTPLVISNVAYGYYLIVTTFEDNGSDAEGTVISQSILDVPTATNITLKASPITISKTVKSKDDDGDNAKTASASIGDTLSYTVASKIINLANYDLKDYTHTLGTDVLSMDIINSNVMAIDSTSKKPTKFHYVFSDTPQYQKLNIESLSITIGDDEYKPYCIKNGEGVEYYFVIADEDSELENTPGEDGKLPENTVADITAFRNEAFARLSVAPYTSDDPNNQFFAINFDLNALKKENLDGKNITIKYDTWITVDAKNIGIDNGATLNYSNNPYDPSDAGKIKTDDDKPDDETHVYTYDFKLKKEFSDNAKFFDKLHFELYEDSALSKPIYFVEPAKVDEENEKLPSFYYVKADQETEETDKVTELELGSDGIFQVHGLGEGTYYLAEVYDDDDFLGKKGYKPITTATIKITPYSTTTDEGTDVRDAKLKLWCSKVDEDSNTILSTPTSVKIDNVAVTLDKLNEYGFLFNVLNQKGFTLPITGENGNWAYAIIGIMLVTSGAVLIFFLFRKKEEK